MLDAGTGTKSWKERGIGQLRILQHKEHSRCRILMRQEKTMKLLINHMLIPGLKLVAHDTSDRAYVWRAEDFADGVVKETDFCVRFADSDLAQAFHQAFVKYQQEMEDLLAGKDKPGNDADEVAEALEGLTTKAEKTAAEKE
jgi:Ran-binding protein 1